MQKKLSIAALAIVASFAVCGTMNADTMITTTLLGSLEVPPNSSLSTGSATVDYITASNEFTYSVSFAALSAPATLSHIHFGLPGVAGPVILPLDLDGAAGATAGTFSGVLTSADLTPNPANGINTFADAVAAFLAGDLYVNVHSSEFPGGEIRGQLASSAASVPEPAAVTLLGLALLAGGGLRLRRKRSPK